MGVLLLSIALISSALPSPTSLPGFRDCATLTDIPETELQIEDPELKTSVDGKSEKNCSPSLRS